MRVLRPWGSVAAVSGLALRLQPRPKLCCNAWFAPAEWLCPGFVPCTGTGFRSQPRDPGGRNPLMAGETACLQAREPVLHPWCLGDTKIIRLPSKFLSRAHANQMTTLSLVGFIVQAFCYRCGGSGLRCKNASEWRPSSRPAS